MNLSDEQKQTIAQLLADGAGIADIQRLITDEFKISITYMDTRFLIDDLNFELQVKEPEPTPEPAEDAAATEADNAIGEATPIGDGSVSVEVDKLTVPGTAVSGTVTFSDGVSAKWYVDPTGRLGLDPETEGYQPTPEDIEAFQLELQKQMQGPGV